MSDLKLTAAEVKEILGKNGIKDIDGLAKMIAESQSGNILQKDVSSVASSWIIKVWKLDRSMDAVSVDDLAKMPDKIGGDIIKRRLAKDKKLVIDKKRLDK